jgi:hypothetical protein
MTQFYTEMDCKPYAKPSWRLSIFKKWIGLDAILGVLFGKMIMLGEVVFGICN